MQQVPSDTLGIGQGLEPLLYHYDTSGEMWTGAGDREVRRTIPFAIVFRSPPAVHLSLALFDLDKQSKARGDLRAEHITKTGFDAVFRIWGDTRVARIRVAWFALGAIAGEDDWDVG